MSEPMGLFPFACMGLIGSFHNIYFTNRKKDVKGIDFFFLFCISFFMIDGVKVKNLRLIPNERGFLVEMLRADDEIFSKFGQTYLSVVYPNVIKGWHYHKIQTDFFTVVKGMAKVVLYDQRKDSKTFGEVNEFFMGDLNRILLVIPPLVLHGMKGIGTEPAYLINCPTHTYNYKKPDEYRVDPYDKKIPYDWRLKEG